MFSFQGPYQPWSTHISEKRTMVKQELKVVVVVEVEVVEVVVVNVPFWGTVPNLEYIYL